MSLSPNEKNDPNLKLDYKTLLFFLIGFGISWINMELINIAPASIEVIAFLSIIGTTFIPAIIISLKHRYWAYGYMFGFASAGIPYLILKDIFIGGYTLATAFFIFLIMWLIFWKTWRTLSAIKLKTN